MRRSFRFIIGIILLFSSAALGQQRFYAIGSFPLDSGDTLFECSVGYRTYGTLNARKSNAILYPTWFGGFSSDLGNLVGEGKLVDTLKYFVIAVDALGNGISTSPSNSRLQNGNAFPEITMGDIVRSQYLLVTRHFGITKLHGIIGGSMGGMQTFEWIAAYPDMMSYAAPYVGTPRQTSYDMLLWHLRLYLIETGRKAGMTDREIRKALDIHTAIVGRTPAYVVRTVPVEKWPEYWKSFDNPPARPQFTIDNIRIQLKSMIGHNIYRWYENSPEKTARAMKAKVFIIVGSKDMTVNPTPALEFAPLIHARTLILDNDCGHIAPGCELERTGKAINEFFDGN